MTALINECASLSHRLVLILDDYHVIASPAVHAALTFLLDFMPPQLHLMIATRHDPPFPLARFRGRGHVTELKEVDLRFTSDEVADFLNQVVGLDLSQVQIEELASRTEGWVAGLQMAAVSLQGLDPVRAAEFVRDFKGSNRHVLDYLAEEVLNRRPPGTQDFLLKTSILDRLNGSLCDAVTGQRVSRELLERLDKANLFILPLDDARHWYRYHRLFADLLRARLMHRFPEQIPSLHRRACNWFEDNGFITVAIEHPLKAGDFHQAAD
jgi:LuxR family maltose regulon positive regulatory protein